jgi:CubicO group peptidase (beta-lactamase class C family)
MQRLFLCFSILFTVFLQGQTDAKAKYVELASRIQKEYNSQNYRSIYKMMDKEFQKQMNEKELGDFFRFNLRDVYGDISGITFVEMKEGLYVFLVDCRNGKLDLALGKDANDKINAMQWLPHKEEIVSVPAIKGTTKYNSDNPKATPFDLKIDSIASNYMNNPANCGLSIAVYSDKQVKYYNYGEVKRGANTLPDKTTLYEIGSVSKTFTGILFAQAILDKKLGMNDPVKKHLGEGYEKLAYKGKNIELVHLANHSGRIHRIPFNLMSQPGYDPKDPYKNYSREMVYDYMKKMEPDTFPGVKNEYSNLGMALLAIIEEKTYGKSFEELVTEYICRPADMKSTKILLNEEEKKRFASGYDTDGKETPHWELGALAGAGGIRSTPEDMMKYAKANLEETIPAFKLSHSTTFNNGRDQVGMAWQIAITKKGNELIWHNGRTAGFSSFCGFIKSKDAAVVVLSNSGNPVDPLAIGILKLLQ